MLVMAISKQVLNMFLFSSGKKNDKEESGKEGEGQTRHAEFVHFGSSTV